MKKEIELSIVIPCYNSERIVRELHKRLYASLNELNIPYEVICVNDCSTDSTLEELKRISNENPNLIVIDLMFNVGQYKAILCGFEHSRGRYVLAMDDDLQHPPEEIHKLYYRIKEDDSIDGVIGTFIEKEHSSFRNFGSLLYNKLNNFIVNKPKNLGLSSFRCFNRKTILTMLSHKTSFPLLSVLMLKSTKRLVNIPIKHSKRYQGKSNYSTKKLLKITFDNIFNYTSFPLKVIGMVGFIAFAISILLSLYYLIRYLAGEVNVTGFTTLILFINFYSGLILFSIGVIGEYLIRIIKEVSGEPPYKVRDVFTKSNFES